MELLRGGSFLTVLQIKETIRLHSLDLVFLFKIKNTCGIMYKVNRKLGFDWVSTVEPIGLAGVCLYFGGMVWE